MAKSKPVQVEEFTSSKRGKLRDPRATQKLSLNLAFAKAARVAAQRKANLLVQADKLLTAVETATDNLIAAAKRV